LVLLLFLLIAHPTAIVRICCKIKNNYMHYLINIFLSHHFHTTLFILRIVAWIIWSSLAIILVINVLFDVKLDRPISFSMLLTLFSQGIELLGLLLSDKDSGSCGVIILSSSSCTDQKKSSQIWQPQKETVTETYMSFKSTLFTGNRLSILDDIVIFFIVSTLLLRSPYYLYVCCSAWWWIAVYTTLLDDLESQWRKHLRVVRKFPWKYMPLLYI
jgi:hypothetical protein